MGFFIILFERRRGNTMEKNADWYLLEGDAVIDMMGRVSTSNLHPSRQVSFWVLGVVCAGKRSIKVGDSILHLTTGDYFLLPPHVHHSGVEIDSHNVYFIHFYMKGTKQPVAAPFIKDVILLPICGQLPKNTDLFQFIDYMDKQYQLDYVGNDFLNIHVKALLYQISVFMQRKSMGFNQSNLRADQLLQFITDRYMLELNADVFEKEFHLTYRQLNHIFKKQFQTTIKQKIIDLKMQHAFNLLINGESVTSVVAQTGFTDYFYFLKCFKSKKGITPKQLQKKYFI
jgi:AraC-like DNA-binding protein